MRIVVIGATGHVGGYLIPQLVERGHDVVAVSRGEATPYRDDPGWERVERVVADRTAEDAAGTFGTRIAALGADVVVDMICFTEDSARQLVDALRGRARQLVHIGTIWTHGTLTEVPATEDAPKRPWGDYGVRKAAIERMLLAQSRAEGGLPVAIVHPGHISGPGWRVIGPQGTLDPDVWRRLATGGEVLLPGFGLETLHHVHAEDVAQLIRLCIEQPEAADSEAFHAVSPQALTAHGFAEEAAGWFGREAELRFTTWDDFAESLPEEHREAALAHLSRSHVMSIEKGRRLLGYAPDHSSLATVAEAVERLRSDGELGEGIPPLRFAGRSRRS
ncbi:NAD-dependent epimerase/dehydratase family protein [Pseudolysinimonas sp.]|uniref:NAD-dependent epimerase/dehydratase family protein n=1 Tax=Pseudolysinimonas sp. TaxID=2680009 RepID=UPI003F823553